MKANGPLMKADGSPMKADGPPMKADGPPTKADGPLMKADGPPMKANGPPMKASVWLDHSPPNMQCRGLGAMEARWPMQGSTATSVCLEFLTLN